MTGSSAETAGVPSCWWPVGLLVQPREAGLGGAGHIGAGGGGRGVGGPRVGEIPIRAQASHHGGQGGPLLRLLGYPSMPSVRVDDRAGGADQLLELAEPGQRVVKLLGAVGERGHEVASSCTGPPRRRGEVPFGVAERGAELPLPVEQSLPLVLELLEDIDRLLVLRWHRGGRVALALGFSGGLLTVLAGLVGSCLSGGGEGGVGRVLGAGLPEGLDQNTAGVVLGPTTGFNGPPPFAGVLPDRGYVLPER